MHLAHLLSCSRAVYEDLPSYHRGFVFPGLDTLWWKLKLHKSPFPDITCRRVLIWEENCAKADDRNPARQLLTSMSSVDVEACSPSKKRRMESTMKILSQPAGQPSQAPTPLSIPTSNLSSSSSSSEKMSTSAGKETTPCLESCPRDSIIAQILANSEADFGEATFCTPGVFFDDSCYSTSTGSDTVGSFSSQGHWTRDANPQSAMMSSNVMKGTRSLLVSTESRSCSLQHNIEQVVADHELITCTTDEALGLCNEKVFQLIWLQLPCPPPEDFLAVITGIRYSSKCNKKTVQLGVAVTHPDIDLNLHGIDEILLEPVSKATIRQKYFDWTSVKLTPDYEASTRDPPLTPTTPESSVSTESAIELSLSSLASDTTNDSGIQGDVNVVDLKPPPPFVLPTHHGTPLTPTSKGTQMKTTYDLCGARVTNGRSATPPSWCRVEHATKEKHRRERIKDSCDQLRVLLPYVRGRKTDMASILEMTVDYLKIINSKLPHEFHSHVLDIMTKGGNSPPPRASRAQVSCGRGSRGGRGRGSRRSSDCPATLAGQQDGSAQGRTVTRALSRGTVSSPVSTISSQGCGSSSRAVKRSPEASAGTSPGSCGVSSLYLVEGKDKGVQREESAISTSMTLPTYPPPAAYPPAQVLAEPPAPSPSTSLAYPPPPAPSPSTSLAYPPPPAPHTSPPDCSLPLPRLYGSAHLAVDPGFLPHGALGGNPPPLSALGGNPPPLSARFGLGADRDPGLAGSFAGEASAPHAAPPPPPPPPPAAAYYHYFSGGMPELGPAYTMAGGGGALCGGDFMPGSILPPPTSAFGPPRLQLGLPSASTSSSASSFSSSSSASRGKIEALEPSPLLPLPSGVGMSGEGSGGGVDKAVYGSMEVSIVKSTK